MARREVAAALLRSRGRAPGSRGEDADRARRISRIRRQEQELALLKKLPAKEFISFNQVRRTHASKTIQRWWRRRESREGQRADITPAPVVAPPSEALSDADRAASRALARKVVAEAAPLTSSEARPAKPSCDSMDLVLIMDRIKARCAEKRSRGGAPSEPGPGGEGGQGGEARSRYQELFDARVQAEAGLDDFHYLMESENKALKHVSRNSVVCS
jgi:hypothetical protein